MTVLAAGDSTALLRLRPQQLPQNAIVTEYLSFTFTDARAAKWRRVGGEQPVQQFD